MSYEEFQRVSTGMGESRPSAMVTPLPPLFPLLRILP